MMREELTKVLLKILENNFWIQPDMLKEENWDIPLTGNYFRLSGLHLPRVVNYKE